MKQRERIGLVIVGTALAWVCTVASARAYSNRLAGLDGAILVRQQKREMLEQQRREAEAAATDWQAMGAATLSMDRSETRRLLRDDLVVLARESGMPAAMIDLGMVRAYQNHGVRVQNATVKGEGSLASVVDFLFDMSQRSYMLRASSLRVEPLVNRRQGSHSTRVGLHESPDRFSMQIQMQVVLMPKGGAFPPIHPIASRDEQPERVRRTLLVHADEYRNRFREDLFRPNRDSVTGQVAVGNEIVNDAGDGGQSTDVQRVAQHHHEDDLVLQRVLSSPRTQQMVLQDPEGRMGGDVRVHVGESVLGGTLMYIHPAGAVVDRGGKCFFHPVGARLAEGRLLTQDVQPEVYDEVSRRVRQ